ncbi:MAG: 4-(cytidine 5'-diphospho)-2-C-methyl-D-erythritol kinase, partial [Bacteroidales bacterium]
ADAAFMIKLLNERFELGMSVDEMERMAATIGADVPFFIENKPVYATGIGDQFESVDFSLKGYYLVLIKPDVSVSTPEAYSMVKPQEPAINIREIIRNPIEMWKDLLVNDFEVSVFARKPIIGEIKQRLYDAGALYASMSGSGSSVFGIFKSEISVDALKQEFDAYGVCIALN